jgi:hypothetical protein
MRLLAERDRAAGLAPGRFSLLRVVTGRRYVEDERTLALLRRYGVDYAQGFHLGHPEPIRGNGWPAVTGTTAHAPGASETVRA